MVTIKIKKLDASLPDPAYAHVGDAAFDLYARERVVVAAGQKVIVPTAFQIEIPAGYVGLIWDKSSIGIKAGIKTLGGVIDSTYRGEIMVGLVNLSREEYVFEKGHKIAQMLIQRVEHATIEIVPADADLAQTARGEGRFGSTGK